MWEYISEKKRKGRARSRMSRINTDGTFDQRASKRENIEYPISSYRAADPRDRSCSVLELSAVFVGEKTNENYLQRTRVSAVLFFLRLFFFTRFPRRTYRAL